ncbi:MAG: hypothetical protein ACRD0P_17085 [Stackebrandtia sp.]
MNERIGALIGSIFGLVFMMVNAGELGEPTALVVRVAAVVLFLAALWFGFIRVPAPASPPEKPSRAAMRVYWTSVLFEVISIPLGAMFITQVLELPDVVVVWVVFVVGVHFLPFARAFAAPVFAVLSRVLIGLAMLGAVLTVAVSAVFAAWTAVLAGVVLLGFSALGYRLSRTATV